MSDENIVIDGFGDVEKDAIGEIMNITMGSAATAVSNMLSAKVWITTPTVSVVKASDLVYPELEPSIRVKIEYTLGVSGQNVLILKQTDVQLILAQLMGLPLEVTDDFEFDEMNISAVCEVMNQMMGSSATALSELIETPIDISTPEAVVQSENDNGWKNYTNDPDEYVCKIKFNLTIDGVIESEFISVLTIDLAKEIAAKMMEKMMGEAAAEEPAPAAVSSGDMSQDEINALLNGTGGTSTPPPPPVDMSGGAGANTSQDAINAMLNGGTQQPAPMQQPMAQQPMMQQPMMNNMGAMPMGGQPAAMPQMNAMPNMGVQMPYPPYGQPMMQVPQQRGAVNVQAVQLQSFDTYTNKSLSDDQNDNLRLLMGVPLNVTVEIGSTKRKIKDILEFTQGTIIELERQAGAPVDVIVNGHLIAKGDVVVIDDNFAVRITEIVRSKFLDNLGKE